MINLNVLTKKIRNRFVNSFKQKLYDESGSVGDQNDESDNNEDGTDNSEDKRDKEEERNNRKDGNKESDSNPDGRKSEDSNSDNTGTIKQGNSNFESQNGFWKKFSIFQVAITLLILWFIFEIYSLRNKIEDINKYNSVLSEIEDVFIEKQKQSFQEVREQILNLKDQRINEETEKILQELHKRLNQIEKDNREKIRELKELYADEFINRNLKALKDSSEALEKENRKILTELETIRRELDLKTDIEETLKRIKRTPTDANSYNKSDRNKKSLILELKKLYQRDVISILDNQVSITLLSASARNARFSIGILDDKPFKKTINSGEKRYFVYDGEVYFLLLAGSGEDWAEISVIRKL